MICKEYDFTIFGISYIVWCTIIDTLNIKPIHGLYPFKVIISRLSSLFLTTLTLSKLFLCFFLAPCFNLTSTFHQRKEILTGPFGSITICCHNHISNDFCCKITNNN